MQNCISAYFCNMPLSRNKRIFLWAIIIGCAMISSSVLAQDTVTKAPAKRTLGQNVDTATTYIKRAATQVKKSLNDAADRASTEIGQAAKSVKRGAQTAGRELKDAAHKTVQSMKDTANKDE